MQRLRSFLDSPLGATDTGPLHVLPPCPDRRLLIAAVGAEMSISQRNPPPTITLSNPHQPCQLSPLVYYSGTSLPRAAVQPSYPVLVSWVPGPLLEGS